MNTVAKSFIFSNSDIAGYRLPHSSLSWPVGNRQIENRAACLKIDDLDVACDILPETARTLLGGDRADKPANFLADPAADWSESIQAVLAQPSARLSRYLIGLGFAFAGIVIAWATVGQMQEVSSATGELVPQGETYKVQSVVAGEIDRVLVEEGDRVGKGDLLFSIDTTLLQNELARLEEKATATREELDSTRSLIEKTRSENVVQQQSTQADMQAKAANWKQSQASAQTQEDLLKRLTEETSAYEERLFRLGSLEEKGAISREYLFEVEQGVRDRHKSLSQVQGELNQNLAQIQQVEAELTQKQALVQQTALVGEQTLQRLIVEANRLESTLADTALQIDEVRTRWMQTQVKSPANGTVSALQIDNTGEVARPGETLLEVVPDDTPLVLSTLVPTAKAGLVKPGMSVTVKLDAFPYQTYGVLSGRVLSVSPDAKGSPETGRGYQVEIDLDKDYVLHEGDRVLLQVGQTATADIVIRQRRIIDLVLDPIRRIRADDFNL